MEKRLLIAVLLVGAVMIISNRLFPPPQPAEEAAAPTTQTASSTPAAVVPAPLAAIEPTPVGPADSIVIQSPLYRYVVSTQGAAVVRAELPRYASYTHPGQDVQLVPPGTLDFLAHRVAVGTDTLDLRAAPFTTDAPRTMTIGGPKATAQIRLTYTGANGIGAEILYTFRHDRYLAEVSGRITGVEGRNAALLTELGPGIEPHEAAGHRAEREVAVIGWDGRLETKRLQKLKAADSIPGPLSWVGVKDKYFLAALVAPQGEPFSRVRIQPLPPAPRGVDGDTIAVPRARVVAVQPLGEGGAFGYRAYLGPQDHQQLAAAGAKLEEVNPYGYRWLRPVIRPIAEAVLWVLSWFHNTLGIGYGWVLILFGVLMRVVLWPLNAKAMRAQMKNMGVQPLMQEIREKYKDDPQRQQQEMVKLYKEHGFNPVAGCLPMLLPFPVLITLFFVFQSTIEFRGESFLWLPDLSLADPFYVLPLFLVVSMFALQWVSTKMSGMEQNPQMKMMMYFMPLMMGVIFFNLPAGLNLYYATTNIATIPQQVLIAKERRRMQEELKKNPPTIGRRGTPPGTTKGGKRRG
jgi:YidC/Oxa1 family membrane protein insertase